VLKNRANRAISPVTDFENKFIPSPVNSLQPIPRLAARPFAPPCSILNSQMNTIVKIRLASPAYPHFAAHVSLAKSQKPFIIKANFPP
jgi:hypothetical protein